MSRRVDGDEHTYHRDRCETSGACVEACPAGALQSAGSTMTVDEAMRDRTYDETSGGGVTLSGGEPLVQAEFARAVPDRCASEGVWTAVETCPHVPCEHIETASPALDQVMIDIKHIDPAEHRVVTGAPNDRILENVERLAESWVPLVVRTPVIPCVNDSADVIGAIASSVSDLDGLE